jgi:nucleotide-binding universal stress UspA family protein
MAGFCAEAILKLETGTERNRTMAVEREQRGDQEYGTVNGKGGKTMRILVPVDGTRECEEAVPLAARMAESFGADIYLVRLVEVIDAFSPYRYDPDVIKIVGETREYLHDLVTRWELPVEKTQCLVQHTDNAAKELVTIAKTKDVDLIVMATHGKKGLRRFFQGSVSDEVIKVRACPVMVVPPATTVGARHWYERLPVPGRGERAKAQATR